jgi:hypothetical protein
MQAGIKWQTGLREDQNRGDGMKIIKLSEILSFFCNLWVEFFFPVRMKLMS